MIPEKIDWEVFDGAQYVHVSHSLMRTFVQVWYGGRTVRVFAIDGATMAELDTLGVATDDGDPPTQSTVHGLMRDRARTLEDDYD